MYKFPYKIIDLTQTLSAEVPTWDESCGFEHCITYDYNPNDKCQFRIGGMNFNKAGTGTHIDAPAHCFLGAETIDQLALENLIVPCVIIDVSSQVYENYSVSLKDIEAYENKHGIIEAGSLVMIRTGWEKYWPTPEKYRNNLVYPFISTNAGELLLKRGVVGLGIDTLSPDRPEDNFPIHRLFLGSGKYLVENVANLANMPAKGGFIMVLPIKIKDGTEAPIRLVGLIKRKE